MPGSSSFESLPSLFRLATPTEYECFSSLCLARLWISFLYTLTKLHIQPTTLGTKREVGARISSVVELLCHTARSDILSSLLSMLPDWQTLFTYAGEQFL